MIPDDEIHRMKHDMYDSLDLRRWVDRLLAERELLVAEHESLGPDRKPAHDAVERFK